MTTFIMIDVIGLGNNMNNTGTYPGALNLDEIASFDKHNVRPLTVVRLRTPILLSDGTATNIVVIDEPMSSFVYRLSTYDHNHIIPRDPKEHPTV